MIIHWMKSKLVITCALLCVTVLPLEAQTIAEKKALLAGGAVGGSDLTPEMQRFLQGLNKDLITWQEELDALYEEALDLHEQGAPEASFRRLLVEINDVKENIQILQQSWREMVARAPGAQDEYALWNQPETTVGQLVIDYGSTDFVYLVHPDIADYELSVNSDLPIPRASWGEMLELILSSNGIGVRQLNPFLRQLYLIEEDSSAIRTITDNRSDLQLFPPDARLCFVISPEPDEVRRIWFFLDKFVNASNTTLQMIGRDILVVGRVSEILALLKIYDFVAEHRGDQQYKIVTLRKVDAAEMTKILETIFDQFSEEVTVEEGSQQTTTKKRKGDTSNGLRVVALSEVAQAIFLVGTEQELKKAETIIHEVESRVGEAREKVIYTYHARHSNVEELAEVLEKIYSLMVTTGVGFEKPKEDQVKTGLGPQVVPVDSEGRPVQVPLPLAPPQYVGEMPVVSAVYPPTPETRFESRFYQQGGYIINPAPIQPAIPKKPEYNKDRNNFIVDPKTSNIVMVVEAEILPKLKDLLKRIDVPKKMVRIEVLLFEKTLNRQNNFGLNLLKLGDAATNTHRGGAAWNMTSGKVNGEIVSMPENAGIFDFFFSRTKNGGIPAYDFAYRFLLTQDDVQINASPSVVTVNQTPAVIAIKEELSLNTGVFEVETEKGVTLKDAFTRAQYGITIEVTPTIHTRDREDEFFDDSVDHIMLDSDITFDTIQPGGDPQQPDVTRRHITNQAVVPDGETVILGGLRRKTKQDSRESIPFFGEIPGLGKLFRITELSDNSTEMFIFITPKIISDPCEDMQKIKMREMQMRPGDLPAFTCRLVAAQLYEKNRVMQGFMTMAFGRCMDRFYDSEPSACSRRGEYDGR